eukprot:jgi/Tetstr1/458121/TSEL_044613.t1
MGAGDLDEEEEAAQVERGYDENELSEDLDEEDELDDFIDDGDGEGGEGQPRWRRKKKKHLGGVSDEAMREAQDIFGDVDSFLQRYQEMKARNSGRDQYDLGREGDELSLSDEDAAEELRAARLERKEQRRLKMVRERIEPDLLAKFGLTDSDEHLRKIDVPERMAADLTLLDTLSSETLPEAARWIYEQLFGIDSRRTWVRDLVEDGRREVDMMPCDGRSAWDPADLEGDVANVQGLRAICRARDSSRVAQWQTNDVSQENLQNAILAVLKCFYVEKFEVPYVAMYRKEFCGELLACRESDLPNSTTRQEVEDQERTFRNQVAYYPEGSVQAKHRRPRRWEVLWNIWESSKRFAKLIRRRQARSSVYEKALELATSEEETDAILACLTALGEAASTEAVNDIENKFRLLTQASADSMANLSLSDGKSAPKASKRTAKYAIAKRAGLGAIAPSLGLSAAQFGENLDNNFKKHEPEDHKVSPIEMAAAHVSDVPGFDSADKVLRGAQHMAAIELASEPAVRQAVRKLFNQHACVSTEPTPRGDEVLDPFHPYGVVKRLRNKPLKKFEASEQYMSIKMAESEGLIKVTLDVPEDSFQRDVMDKLSSLYISEGVSLMCQEWNQIRKQMLLEAVKEHLWPTMVRETRAQLEADAQSEVLTGYSSQLWKLASAPPIQVKKNDSDEYVDDVRVMAVVWGPGGSRRDAGPATAAVLVDSSGHMVDFLNLPQLSGRGGRPASTQTSRGLFQNPRKERDANRVRDFIVQHEPHVIVIGASGLDSWQLKQDMKAVYDVMMDENAQFISDLEAGRIDIRFASDAVARLWASTPEAAQDISEQGDQVRKAVGLARSLLEPLAVLSSLCGAGQEILSLPLHTLQTAVSKEARMHTVEQVMVTAVNQVGVDLNLVTQCSWMAPMVQFVCGLGNRKAAALIAAVGKSDGGCVQSRMDVYKKLNVMEKTVFINCGAFLRIRK